MMRAALRFSLITLGLLLLVIIACFALLQSSPGKRLLATQLSSMLTTEDSGIEIVGIDGWIPLDMQLSTLRLSDREGVWLEAEDIAVDWSPSALLNGRIQIETVGAATIDVMRSPVASHDSAVDDDGPFRLPELPASIPALTVQRLAVLEVILGEPVFGEKATFDLVGFIEADDDDRTITAKLALERTDEPTASVTLDSTLDLATTSLDVRLEADERGGLVGAIAGRPEIDRLSVAFDGSGPLESWSGTLSATADDLATIDLDLGLALVDQPEVTIEGIVQPSVGLLPADIASLIGEKPFIDLEVVQTGAQALVIRKAHLKTGIASLEASGSVDFDADDLVLEAGLQAPDLGPLQSLAGAELGGAAQASLSVGGALSAPVGQLSLVTKDLVVDGRKVRTISTDIGWTTPVPLGADNPAFDLVIEGEASGIVIPDVVLPDDAARWQAGLTVPLEGPVTIERAEIETAEATLAAKGRIDPTRLAGALDLELKAPSLLRLVEPYGQDLDGEMLANAAIGIEDGADVIDVDLDAVLDRLANLPPGASELLGQRAKLQAKARFQQGEARLALESLALDAEGVGLLGRGDVDIERGGIESEVSIALPDLSAFDSLVEGGVAGAGDLELQIGGSFDAPSVDLTVDGQDLVISGEAVRTLSLTADGRNLIASPEGSIAVALEARDVPASLGFDYRLDDQRLDLAKLLIEAPESKIGGDLIVGLDTGLIDGTVVGRISDLGALAPLIGQQLLGDIDVSATLLPDESEQGVSLSLKGRGIEGDFGRIEAITSDVVVADSFGDARLSGKATVTGFEQGEVVVDAVTLTTEGGRDRLGFQLKSVGEAFQPFDVAAEGAIGVGDGLVVDLSRLEGAFAGEPVRLARPSTFRMEGERLSLSDLDISLGEARLSGEVEIGAQAAKGTIDLRALPLSWSEVFGGPALGGRIDADIDLAGSAAEPKVTAAIAAIDVIGDDVTIDVAPIDIALEAQFEKGRLAADLSATGLTAKPITANARMPMQITLQPFSLETPDKGPLDGRIEVELQLEKLADLLALEGQTMAGLIDVDLTIGGTLGEPRISGPIELTGASYQNDASGTDIQDLNLNAVASTERIDVKSLTGRTGKSGTLEANGWMQLDSSADFPLSLRLSLDQARLVDLDDVEGVISGELTMIGNLVDPSIEGALNIDRAEIQIPDGGGADLPALDVEERGGNIVNPPEEEAADAEQSRPFDPNLGIGVTLPNKVYVRGRGLESEWQGDLRITGRASKPSIVGDLSIKKGYFDFLDKRFELEQGEISFSGETPPNPILALQAASEEDDFRAIIRLSGPASDPQILLESEPVLPDDEVLARLLFNRELSEIGPVEAGKLALAANRLRGGGGFDAFGEIRGLLKIDTLDVVSDDEGESRVRAGKYLGDDVYVEVEKGAADESGRARVEIELLPNIAVEAETSENADSGVGIKWKLDY